MKLLLWKEMTFLVYYFTNKEISILYAACYGCKSRCISRSSPGNWESCIGLKNTFFCKFTLPVAYFTRKSTLYHVFYNGAYPFLLHSSSFLLLSLTLTSILVNKLWLIGKTKREKAYHGRGTLSYSQSNAQG